MFSNIVLIARKNSQHKYSPIEYKNNKLYFVDIILPIDQNEKELLLIYHKKTFELMLLNGKILLIKNNNHYCLMDQNGLCPIHDINNLMLDFLNENQFII